MINCSHPISKNEVITMQNVILSSCSLEHKNINNMLLPFNIFKINHFNIILPCLIIGKMI